VVSWSNSQMGREEQSGATCGVPSSAGRGPLYNARLGVRDSITSLRDGITRSWLAPVQAEVAELGKVQAFPTAAHSKNGKPASRRSGGDSNQGKKHCGAQQRTGVSTAADMRALANGVSIQPNQLGFSCYDRRSRNGCGRRRIRPPS